MEFDEYGRLVITLTDGTILDPVEIPQPEEHVHTYTEWVMVKNASCTEVGLQLRFCLTCDAVDYAFENGTLHTEVIDAAVAATCTKNGLTEGAHCSVCGVVLKAQETVYAQGHWYEDYTVITEPTCSEEGVGRSDCANCDHYELSGIAALGHNYLEEWIVWDKKTPINGKDPEYYLDGSPSLAKEDTIYLKLFNGHVGWIFGKSIMASHYGIDITLDDMTILETFEMINSGRPMATHIVTKPTCTSMGYTTHTCACGASFVDSYVDALGHTPGAEATCSAAQTCTVCGTELAAALAHTEVIDAAVAPTYTETGLTEGSHCSVCNTILVAQQIIPVIAKPTYHTITYRNLKGTETTITAEYSEQEGLLNLLTPSAEGYIFVGWYTASSGGALIDYIPKGSSQDYVLFAHWEKETYQIQYEKAPVHDNPLTYTVEDTIYLNDPQWSGLEFVNWTNEKGEIVTKIEKGTVGDLVLTANWATYRNKVITKDNSNLKSVYDKETGQYIFICELGMVSGVVVDSIVETYKKTTDADYTMSISQTVSIEQSVSDSTAIMIGESTVNSTEFADFYGNSESLSGSWNLSGTAEFDIGVVTSTIELGTEWSSALSQSASLTQTTVSSKTTEDKTETTHMMSYMNQMTTSSQTSINILGEMPNGTYAYVHAVDVRVYAIVVYNVEENCYYLELYSIMSDMYTMLMYYASEYEVGSYCDSLACDVPVEDISEFMNSVYFVRYDSNTGEDDACLSVLNVGKETKLQANEFDREGYTFLGWSLTPDGEATYLDEALVKDLAQGGEVITLYAVWDPFSYTITWDEHDNYLVNVERVSSSNKNAPLGALSIGSTIYYGDGLKVTYTAISGYLFETTGNSSISVVGNVDSTMIYATLGDRIPGLYDANLELIASWDELVNTYGMDVTYDYELQSESLENPCHPYYVLTNNEELSSGTHLVLGAVDSIGMHAFINCDNLIEVVLSDSVTSIGYCAFSGCTNLTSIILSENVTTIGCGAFQRCKNLVCVTIPDSVINIEDFVFTGCNSLSKIILPKSVTSIGDYAFSSCDWLSFVYYTGTEEEWAAITIGSDNDLNSAYIYYNCAISADDALVYMFDNESETYAIAGYRGTEAVVVIPSTYREKPVTSICALAFYSCTSLTNITIPDSITNIGEGAFLNCSNLTSITIPNSVTNIGTSAFRSCSNLTSITIPDSVTSIGDVAFDDCSSLTSITISNSVTSIGYNTFDSCTSLTSITIPNSVTSIGYRAFYNCSGLMSITIGDSVTNIGNEAFRDCSKLTSVNVPESVTSIGNKAFYCCSSLTSITIGDSVTNIGNGVFEGCMNLNSVTIGGSVTSIGECAFYCCAGLTSITIPDSVTSIGFWAFIECSNLTSITFEGTMEQWNAIIKGSDWSFNVPATEVICSDGIVTIN